MNFSVGKRIIDIIRYVIIAALFISAIVIGHSLGGELIFIYIVLTAFAIINVEVKNKNKLYVDIVLPITALFMGTYVNHAIALFNDILLKVFSINSIVLYTSFCNKFSAIGIEFLFIIAFYFLLRAARVKPGIAAIVSTIPLALLCIADYYVLKFRGTELSPADITSIRTAMNVAGNYTYNIKYPFVTVVCPLILYGFAVCRIKVAPPRKTNSRRAPKKENKLVSSLVYLGISIVFILTLVFSVQHLSSTQKIYHWGKEPARNNGFITNFALQITELIIEEPENYDRNAFEGITESNVQAVDLDTNIIVIMSESYTDFSIYDDIFPMTTNPTPYWDSLKTSDNVRSGFVYSSVFGGNTANSEFEMLTGITTAGLPDGSVPYSMYINNPIYSLPAYLSSLGYTTTSLHPFIENGWNRPATYPRLGFDNSMFINDFEFTTDDFARGMDVFYSGIGFLSDRCTYENLLNVIDSNDSGNPGFYFLITIQNHGSYTIDYEINDPDAYVEDTPANQQLNVYLTNINKSDAALEYLLDELSSRDERYTVLIFGDHQPAIDVLDSLQGELGAGERKWVVPYLLWTNYDMPEGLEGSDNDTSINYLSLDVLHAAGVPLSPYFDYIEAIRHNIPIINSTGYFSNVDNSWHELDDSSNPADDVSYLNMYYAIQYYSLFDSNYQG